MLKLIVPAVLAACMALSGSVNAGTVVKSTVRTESTFAANSVEVRGIEAWLYQNASYVDGKMVGDLNKLGTVKIVYTSASRSPNMRPMSPGDGPPVPLPASGQAGDTISISSSHGGYTQTWEYEWVPDSNGGHWVLTRYEYIKTAIP